MYSSILVPPSIYSFLYRSSAFSRIYTRICSQCIMNLVANGLEAMGDSGVMRVSTRNQDVDQSIVADQDMEPGKYAVVRIEDSGGGISEKDLDRIFEPFYSKKVMGRSVMDSGIGAIPARKRSLPAAFLRVMIL